jgi:glycosyltransferase involved in cell wall biosynthesis
MKKIGIYDPYLHILGGAERYIGAIAQCLKSGGQVTIYDANASILKTMHEKFGLMLEGVIGTPWPKKRALREKELKMLDYFFYVTDGSLFFSPATRNFLIIQSPAHIPAKSLLNHLKLRKWQTLIVYSDFMAKLTSKSLGRKPQTLFVPINPSVEQTKKENSLILSVGRFFTNLHNKKQYEMVEIFKELSLEIKNLELMLVGSVDPGSEAYVEKVKVAAAGFPIQIVTNISYHELSLLYQKAYIYWHAAGFGEDLRKHPDRAEHFGVVTVEAMSCGTVPVVFAGGGQTEIVTSGKNGFTWQSKEELKDHTKQLLTDKNLYTTLSKAARVASMSYSQAHFCQKLYEILD